MYNQSEALLEQYDLDIKQITKGRGAYICDTSQGMKLLMPFRGSKERAAFLREVLQYLQEEGVGTEQICLTKEGEASVEDEYGKRYWLKDMISGSECRTGIENDLALNGRDLIHMGMQPGKQLGAVLDGLFELVLEHPEWYTRERLEKEAHILMTRLI